MRDEEQRENVAAGGSAEAAVIGHFDRVTRELHASLGKVAEGSRILFAAFHDDAAFTEASAVVLSHEERARAEKFATADVRQRFVQRRAFRRYAAMRAVGAGAGLAMLDFAAEAKGRPWLPAAPRLSWSVSSCRSGMLAAWSPTAEIGVDLEDRARVVDCLPLAKRYFAPQETRLVEEAIDEADRLAIFLRFWCLKEAVLKAIGEGLAYGLERFAFLLEPTVRLVAAPEEQGGVAAFRAAELVGPPLDAAAATAAVVVRLPPPVSG